MSTPINEAPSTEQNMSETPATDASTQQEQQPLGEPGKAALDAERKEKRELARALKDANAKLAAFEEQGKTDLQKVSDRATNAEKERDAALTRYVEMAKRTEITTAAVNARAVDTDAVYALIRDEVSIDDDGNVVGLDDAMKRLQKSKPFLFPAAPAGTRDANAGTAPIALNDGDALSRALLQAVNR